MRRPSFVVALVLAGCGTSAAPAPAPPAGQAASESACQKDADCTFVALGCCATTPVNRASAASAKKRLEASGQPVCPPKSACGPGPDGTWEGTPGTCRAGTCAGGP